MFLAGIYAGISRILVDHKEAGVSRVFVDNLAENAGISRVFVNHLGLEPPS